MLILWFRVYGFGKENVSKAYEKDRNKSRVKVSKAYEKGQNKSWVFADLTYI